jgi:hypothetical protein
MMGLYITATFLAGVACGVAVGLNLIKKPQITPAPILGWHLRAGRDAGAAGAEMETEAFERGRAAGKKEAELETKYGSFSAHIQSVFHEARKLRDALEGDKLADGLGAELNAHDDFISRQLRT